MYKRYILNFLINYASNLLLLSLILGITGIISKNTICLIASIIVLLASILTTRPARIKAAVFLIYIITNLIAKNTFIPVRDLNISVSEVSGIIKEISLGKVELLFPHINGRLATQRVQISSKLITSKSANHFKKYDHIAIKGNLSISSIKNIGLYIKESGEFSIKTSTNFFAYISDKVSQNIKSTSQKYFKDQSGRIEGVVFGITDSLESDDKKLFQDLGISHVLVASGANILFILNVITFLTLKLPANSRKGVQFLIIFLYILVVGIEGSIMRAFFFFIVMQTGNIIGREVTLHQKVLLAVFFTTLIFPQFIKGLSFQLSLAATLALALGSDLAKFLKVKNNFLSLFVTNIIIVLITGLISAYAFKNINLSGLISNILVLPVIEFCVIYGFIYILIACFIAAVPILHVLEKFVAIFALPLEKAFLFFNSFLAQLNSLLNSKLKLEYQPSLKIVIAILIMTITLWFIIKMKEYARQTTELYSII